ncbi:hypothetical protein Pcinc_012072 [Petrolisthes cinctipes]|uniref:SAM domain-containing protein n=1 Tax=Petrolisthes cinctipes TaxID=88211 RepID=A0AAE1G1H3_PETCI|nr:hypothetical protein Pcinc_012072 [Petrolisthes cinctipes]
MTKRFGRRRRVAQSVGKISSDTTTISGVPGYQPIPDNSSPTSLQPATRWFLTVMVFTDLFLTPEAALQPITQWSSSNVVDWMATLNLAPYSELFKAKDIKGTDLLSLDRDKLVPMSRGVDERMGGVGVMMIVMVGGARVSEGMGERSYGMRGRGSLGFGGDGGRRT